MKRFSAILLLLLLLAALVLPVCASEQAVYVIDAAGLLSYDEWSKLEAMCSQVSDRYGCGIYIITVEDHRDYGDDDVFEVAYELYHGENLGRGAERDGVLLFLSMAWRDYALFVYGDGAEYAFDVGGQIGLEEAFLPALGEDQWYSGFSSYVSTCDAYLLRAENGDPVRADMTPMLPFVIGGALLIALVVCSILKAGMKNVSVKAEAGDYMATPLKLTRRHDQYTHTTKSRVKIQSSSGGSGSRSGGGGSGRSGKF